MRILIQTLAVLLALAAASTSAPATVEKRNQRFTLQQGDRMRTSRSPAANYMRALRKFQGWVPDNVAAAVKNKAGGPGTAPAIPEEFDSEYLTPITIAGQGMNVAIDTGSSDLYVFGAPCATFIFFPSVPYLLLMSVCSVTRWVFSSELSESVLGEHDFYTPDPESQKLEDEVWRVEYGDGTTASGDVYIDSVVVGDITSPEQAVGAASKVSDELIDDENNDGIMGISFTSLSMSTYYLPSVRLFFLCIWLGPKCAIKSVLMSGLL